MSYTDETSLKEMLQSRPAKELVVLLKNNGLEYPWKVTANEKKLLWDGFFGHYPEDYYEESMEKNAFARMERDEDESEEEYQKRRKWEYKFRRKIRHTGQLLRDARAHAEEMANAVAEKLMQDEVFERAFQHVKPELATLLLDEGRGEDGFVKMDLTREKAWKIKNLEKRGYITLKRIPAEKTADCREHIVGVMVPAEVRARFRELYTPAWRLEDEIRSLVSDCCYVIMQYHNVSLLENAWKLYAKAEAQRNENGSGWGEMHRVVHLDYSDFAGIVEKMAKVEEDSPFVLRKAGEQAYIFPSYMLDILEDEEDMTLEDLVSEYEPEEEYYIPEPAEMEDYLKYGYWHRQQPYAELGSFVEDFYKGEQSLENAGRNMFMAALAANGEDGSFRKMYSDDMVDDRTEEKTIEIADSLRMGETAASIYKWQERITAWLNKEGRKEFRHLLRECEKVTPRPEQRGFTLEQMKHRSASSGKK